jgi:hypothetical protein
MRTSPLWLAPLLLLGCSSPSLDEKTYKTLAELRKPEIFLVFEGSKPRLQLYTDYQQGCPSFAGTGLMNGSPLTLVAPGGFYQEFGSQLPICRHPTWSLPTPLPSEAVTELAIEDETGSLRMGVSNLGATRGVKYRAPTTSNLRWGQLVEVEVVPSTDSVRWALPVTLRPSGSTSLAWSVSYDAIDKDRAEEGILSFRLPEQPPQGWPSVVRDATLVFPAYNEVHPGLTHCEPSLDQCLAKLWLSQGPEFTLPLTIE